MAQRIGDLIFTWDPDKMTIPESKKTVGIVPTYSGSAIFQWESLLEGVEVVLKWKWMPVAQYDALRLKYISTSIFEWNPDIGGNSYNVIVTSLVGEYFEVLMDDIPYRENVELRLSIRTAASTTTSSTTSTTSTTVTGSSTSSTTASTTSSTHTTSSTSTSSSTASTTSTTHTTSTSSSTSSTASTTSSTHTTTSSSTTTSTTTTTA